VPVVRANLPPYRQKSLDSRTAISGDTPRFPFTSSESVLRDTPKAVAASVIVKPDGSMHWRKTMPPGCGGFLIVMGSTFLSSGNRHNQRPPRHHRSEKSLASWPEPSPPKPFHLAFERMQPEARQVHVTNRRGSIERSQNVP
jgi:hypothetical protein